MIDLIKLVPKGEFPHSSGLIQVMDDVAIAAMVGAFDPKKKVLVDFDHYSELTPAQLNAVKAAGVQLPSEAAGWITAVESRTDGLYGRVELTPAGEAAVKNNTYRWHSPVFRRRDLEIISEGRVRPTALSKVGLTNEPNIREMPALANSEKDELVSGPAIDFLANSVNPEVNTINTKRERVMDYKSKLLAVLGLPADAADDQIDSAIGAMKTKTTEIVNAQEEAETEKKRLETENKALDEEKKVLSNRLIDFEKAALKTKVDAALKDHEGVITNRADIEEQLTKDFDGTLKVLNGLKALPNRADGGNPDLTNNDKDKPTGLARVKAAFAK